VRAQSASERRFCTAAAHALLCALSTHTRARTQCDSQHTPHQSPCAACPLVRAPRPLFRLRLPRYACSLVCGHACIVLLLEQVLSYEDLFPSVEPGCLLAGTGPARVQRSWDLAASIVDQAHDGSKSHSGLMTGQVHKSM
jgi:hypothetical protein